MNAPAPLTTWGDPRLTTDLWVQRKPGGGARSGARALAGSHGTWPRGDWNLLLPPALGDTEQLGKKLGAAGEGRPGNGGNRVNLGEFVLIGPGLPGQSLLVQPAESNPVSKMQPAELERVPTHIRIPEPQTDMHLSSNPGTSKSDRKSVV